MEKQALDRLVAAEQRIKELAEEYGLLTTDTLFEVVPARRVIEGISYMFPTNFSHWTFGRDYEKHRTLYEHTGQGIPYEVVWNFDVPRALLVETNPLALNILVLAHVFGHVDFFLGSRYLQHGRTFSNVSEEARNAVERFSDYESRYGEEVEKVIDAGMSIMWHQHPDPFFEEQDEDVVRERVVELRRAKLEKSQDVLDRLKHPQTQQEITVIERELRELQYKTPPEPTHDILRYIIKNSPKKLKPWVIDVLTVLRNQARCLAPNRITKILNEGWATYWHVKIMRRLFDEGFLTAEEHEIFNTFHSGVTRENRKGFNEYRIGWKLFEYIEERWNKGRFGREYEMETDPTKRANWDTGVNKGLEKIFEVRSFYTDRMAVEEFFTEEFIRAQDLYIYISIPDEEGNIIDVIAEDDPEVIRGLLKSMLGSSGPQIVVENGDYKGQLQLYLKHIYSGYELDERHRNGVLENIHYLWGRRVFLECIDDEKEKLFSYDKKKKLVEEDKPKN